MIPDRQFCEYNYEKERRRSFAHSQSEVSWRTYNNPDNYIISLDEWILNPDKEPTYSPEKERRHFRASFNTTSEKLNTLEISDGKKEMKVEFELEKKAATRKEIIARSKKIKEVKKQVLALCKKFPIKEQY